MTTPTENRTRHSIVANALELCNSRLNQSRADVLSVREQLQYLLKVLAGEEDGGKLGQLNFGVIVAKSIEPADDDAVKALHEASAVAQEMAHERGPAA